MLSSYLIEYSILNNTVICLLCKNTYMTLVPPESLIDILS